MKKDSSLSKKGFDKFQKTKTLDPKQLKQVKGGNGNNDNPPPPPEDDEEFIHEDVVIL